MKGDSFMNNKSILRCVYNYIFDKDFEVKNFEDRLLMQKSVYLMQEMGTSCGDYDYFWYKFGPYSQSLQNDILDMLNNTSECDVNNFKEHLTDRAKANLDNIKGIIAKNPSTSYSNKEWLEAIASLHFLKNYMFLTYSDEKLLEELSNRKSYLNDKEANKIALESVKAIK